MPGLANEAMEEPRFEISLRKDMKIAKGWPLEARPLDDIKKGAGHE